MLKNICVVYIDDILMFGKAKHEHSDNLSKVRKRLVLTVLEEYLKKGCIEHKEIFLGYRISKNNIIKLESRTQAIVDYKRLENRSQLQNFIGIRNYDRILIENLSIKIKPVYELLVWCIDLTTH